MSITARKLVWALVLAGFAFRLQFVAHDMQDLVTRGPLYDDSFYCFEIARNIAQGYGSTFDRIHATNGYQPLYVLALVPLYAIAGDHATLPIYIALIASALLNALTGLILFRVVRRFASMAAAFFALLLWSFGPAIVRQSVNGLETALAMFLIAATLDYYLSVYRPSPKPSGKQAATLGVLLGLAILARVDAVLFAVALGFDVLRRRRTAELRGAAVAAVVAAGVLLPWAVASWRMVGTPFPESGTATRFLSEAYAPHDHPELAGQGFDGRPPALFFVGNLVRSLLQLGTSPVVHLYTRGLERLGSPLQFETPGGLYLLTVILGALAIGLALAAHRSRLGRPWLRDFGFLFVYCGLLLAAYSFVVFGQIFYSRYYYPIFFVSILVGALAFDLLIRVLPAARRRPVGALLFGIYALALPYMCMHRMQNGNYRFLRVVDWIETHTPPGAAIGVFNSGAIAYFSDRRVVNLDGKVNPEALAALRSGQIRDYVDAEGIEYVIDHEWILGHFLFEGSESDGLRFSRVDGERALGVPGWGAYQIERVSSSASRTPSTVTARRGS